MTELEVVQSFINHIWSGNMDAAQAMVAPDAKFISTRPVPNPQVPLHGTFVGPAGAQQFFQNFAALLEPGDFKVDASFAQGEHVAMYGSLRHRSRQTGRDFASDWALICRVRQGRLTLYHFYEDTDALVAAIAPV